MGTLWASPSDRACLRKARSAVLLVGGYDGSGNYGDILQVATAIETARHLPGEPLPVVVVERETLGHHRSLVERYAGHFDAAVFAHFQGGEDLGGDDGLVELTGQTAPARSVIYLYGGGYLNQRWGARKKAHVDAAERIAKGRRPLPVAASGLQLDEQVVAPGGVARELLARAAWIGVRDSPSLEYVNAALSGDRGAEVVLAGDDALPFLAQEANPDATVNLHLNDGVWVSDDWEATSHRIVEVLKALATAAAAPLRLQPVIAYEDPRVSERRVIESLLSRYGDELEAAGFVPAAPLDILEDALENRLDSFRKARLTVSCSYHVTLTSLVAGIPTVLLAGNEYYEQKAEGLRDHFRLDHSLIGVTGSSDEAAAAKQAFVEGPFRSALVSHLRSAAREVAARYELGHRELANTLADFLGERALRNRIGDVVWRAVGSTR